VEYEHGAILGHLKTLSSRPHCVTMWESFSEGGVREMAIAKEERRTEESKRREERI